MINISLFSSCKLTKPDEIISVNDFINAIKYGKWKHLIDPIREEKEKEKRKILKEKIPGVTISGLFEVRNQNSLIKHSGFICVDIDGFTDKKRLVDDPFTFALFSSASGGGLAIMVKINPEKHKESFKFLQSYYFNSYGIVVDPAPQNVASLRFVSYDPDIFINEKSKVSKVKTEEKQKPKALPLIVPEDKVSEYVKEVQIRGLNIAPDYKSYLELGFALANGFKESGRSYFHAICSNSEKYNSKQADRQFDICLKGSDVSGITVGTFYFMLKQVGIKIENENHKAVQIAALAKKSKRTKEGVVETLVQTQGVERKQAEILVEQVFQRDDISLKSVAADPERLIESLTEWLRQNHPIRKNSITRNIEENGNEVKKERLNTIFLRARAMFNTPNISFDLIERMIFSDLTPEFNPIKEYIDRNRHKNNHGQIDLLIKTIQTKTPHADIFIRKWLISIIAAYEGYPVRSVLALVGGQNTGKTEWFRRLLPSALHKYYAESKLDAGKDDEMLMCQKLIVMDDEMGGKSKQDEKRFKELTSKAVFSLRAPYGRANEDFKRLALLCGTSNSPEVVNDPTGNTRILPIYVQSINHSLYNEIDKDELFMELVRAYEAGEEWQLTREELASLNRVSSDFEQVAFERELISQFFLNENSGGYVDELTATEIKNYIEINTKQNIKNMTRFGIELRKILGEKIQKRKNGTACFIYRCVKINQEPKNPYSGNFSQSADNEDIPF